MRKVYLLLLTILATCGAREISASVKINEISPLASPDWVELVNVSTQSADLSAYILRDSTATNKRILSGELSPGGITVVDFGNFLNKTGDTVRLIRIANDRGETADDISYGDRGGICLPEEGMTIGRLPDGGAQVTLFLGGSKGLKNTAGTEVPCQSPTPTPVKTPVPQVSREVQTPVPSPLPVPTDINEKEAAIREDAAESPVPASGQDEESISPRTDITDLPEKIQRTRVEQPGTSSASVLPGRGAGSLATAKIFLFSGAMLSAVSAAITVRKIFPY